jgi:uncharacterized protein (DUF305 family)
VTAAPSPFRRTLITAAAVLALVAAVPAGLALPSAERTGRELAVPAKNSVAVGFSRDMAVHHQQAVEMSFLVLGRGTSGRVHTLAYDIANTQAVQRGMMLGWLSLWGRTPTSGKPAMSWMHMPPPSAEDRRAGVLMPGMASRSEMDRLGVSRGRDADLLYLRLMTAHHRGGVHMAEGVTEGSAPAVVVRSARKMADGQRAEIALMTSLSQELRKGR